MCISQLYFINSYANAYKNSQILTTNINSWQDRRLMLMLERWLTLICILSIIIRSSPWLRSVTRAKFVISWWVDVGRMISCPLHQQIIICRVDGQETKVKSKPFWTRIALKKDVAVSLLWFVFWLLIVMSGLFYQFVISLLYSVSWLAKWPMNVSWFDG